MKTKTIASQLFTSLPALGLILIAATPSFSASNIDANNKFAWTETSGWVNFSPSSDNVLIYDDHIEGYAWAENFGWIKLGSHTTGGPHRYDNQVSANWGVNRDNTVLSGFAWSDAVGWINFKPTGGGVTLDATSGVLDGFAWSENIGWIRIKNTSQPNHYGVAFDPLYGMHLVPTSGAGQSAATGTSFATRFMVTVTNLTGNPVPGISVSFSAPTSGPSGSFSGSATVISDINGEATAPVFEANALAGGPYSVTAAAGSEVANFQLTNAVRRTYSATTATKTGTASATLSGTGEYCTFAKAAFVAPPASLPPGVTFPDGLFDFTTTGCTGTISITVHFPSNYGNTTNYWKYGPLPPGPLPKNSVWYTLDHANNDLQVSGNTATFTITDGGRGDDDLSANGTIVDQGGLGLQAVDESHPIPTLSYTLMAMLAVMIGFLGVRSQKHRPMA